MPWSRTQAGWAGTGALLAALVLAALWRGGAARRGAGEAAPPAVSAVPGAPDPLARLLCPTDQALDRRQVGAFQPTASGRPESALYGSVRTRDRGGRLLPSFHEGVDIAVVRRDRAGRPLDDVRAAAGGTVAYLNRIPGNSAYGRYAVLDHASASGTLYTLYAHLADFAPGLAAGQALRAGDPIGRIGNTGVPAIPAARAHLHFEIGLMLNRRFGDWYRGRRLKPWHGIYHGWNLLGVDPLRILDPPPRGGTGEVFARLAAVPAAFEVVLAARRRPDFFDRYPGFWSGAPYDGRGVCLAVSENGLPLAGRNATADERRALGSARAAVTRVIPEVLGRNGAQLVRCAGGRWSLAPLGEQWRAILLH